jgi:protein DEK
MLTNIYHIVDHYKIDLEPRKGAIKIMIQEELTKLSEADSDEDEQEDVEKKQPRRRAKVTA